MPRKLPTRDPGDAHRRKVVAARRVGIGARCSCGEDRPGALIAGSNPTICAACERAAKGRSTTDDHHSFGRANNPATIPVPVNDHRADLSGSQAEWPKSTLRNTEGSPLLAGAACVRGFIDTILYLIEKGLLWLADMLEKLDQVLLKKLGPKWWVNTEIEQFAPKKKKPGAKA
jgi:hypothetical protein